MATVLTWNSASSLCQGVAVSIKGDTTVESTETLPFEAVARVGERDDHGRHRRRDDHERRLGEPRG